MEKFSICQFDNKRFTELMHRFIKLYEDRSECIGSHNLFGGEVAAPGYVSNFRLEFIF